MKRNLWLVALSLFVSLFSNTSNAISQTGTANARVVTPLAFNSTTALEFGSFASSSLSGTITHAGDTTGGVTAISSGATRAAGTFVVSGESNASGASYTFTLPATATLNGPGPSMTVSLSLVSGSYSAGSPNNGSITRTLGATGGSNPGKDNITVYGSLAVAANQTAGSYTGTYTVSAIY